MSTSNPDSNPLFESPVAHIFYPEYVQEQFEQMPERILSGEAPEEFVWAMCVDWMFGQRRTYTDGEGDGERIHGSFFVLTRSDLPEGLRQGLGEYQGAVIRDGEVDLHRSEALARFEWDRTVIEEAGAEEHPDD